MPQSSRSDHTKNIFRFTQYLHVVNRLRRCIIHHMCGGGGGGSESYILCVRRSRMYVMSATWIWAALSLGFAYQRMANELKIKIKLALAFPFWHGRMCLQNILGRYLLKWRRNVHAILMSARSHIRAERIIQFIFSCMLAIMLYMRAFGWHHKSENVLSSKTQP